MYKRYFPKKIRSMNYSGSMNKIKFKETEKKVINSFWHGVGVGIGIGAAVVVLT